MGFGAPFVLIVYLAMEAGGYDLIVRSQVGIIIWWVILLGIIAGLFPLTRLTRVGWIGLLVMGTLVLWTAIATLIWTESTERSMVELSRTIMLFGVLGLFLLLQDRDSLRRSVSAIGAAVAVVAVVALASRFQPDWFPSSGIPENFPTSRLNHPLEYWNGLAAFLAVGLAPLIWVAGAGRSVIGRAFAAGAVPLVVLALYLTASRGGAIEACVAVALIMVLYPKRIALAVAMIAPAIGSAMLVWLIAQRPELRDRELGDLATSQGSEMLWLALVVFGIVAAAQASIAIAIERRKLTVPVISRTVARRTGISAAVAVVLLLVVAVGSGFVGDRWSDFKQPAAGDGTVTRLGDFGSGERYKVWDSAVEASASEKITGIGPGTFEYWWARNGEGVQFVRDGHSLYLEALAEMGPIGFLLVIALVVGPVVVTGRRAIGPGSSERRGLLASATAGMAAFAVAAGVDWAWEMTVIPVLFLVLFAAAAGPAAESRRGRRQSRFAPVPVGPQSRAACVAVSIAAIAVIALPLIGTTMVRESQEQFRSGDVDGALSKAEDASKVEPYSASAETQVALIQAELGNREAALSAAEEATADEPTNWRTWLTLGELLRRFGDEPRARASFERAASLNVRSSLPELSTTLSP